MSKSSEKGMGGTSLCAPSYQPGEHPPLVGGEQDLESEVPIQSVDLGDLG